MLPCPPALLHQALGQGACKLQEEPRRCQLPRLQQTAHEGLTGGGGSLLLLECHLRFGNFPGAAGDDLLRLLDGVFCLLEASFELVCLQRQR